MTESKHYEILLIGKTGDGKSTLGNLLLDDNGKEIFIVCDDSESGTQITQVATHENPTTKETITIIDTPGLLDSKNKAGEKNVDVEHYKQMIQTIKQRENLNGILLVKDSNNIKYSIDIQEMIKMICNTFGDSKIFKNIGFVFTKFYMSEKQKQKIRENAKKDFINKAKDEIAKFFGGENSIKDFKYTFESFFIDSDLDILKEKDVKNEKYKEMIFERQKIYNWVIGLDKINPKELPNNDPEFRRKFYYPDSDIDVTEDFDYIYKTVTFYSTLKGEDLNGHIKILEERKLVGKTTTKIPKKLSIFKKIFGGIAMGLGVICALPTGGTSLLATAGGAGLYFGGKLDDFHNEDLRENAKK
jgi:hypothetical protein